MAENVTMNKIPNPKPCKHKPVILTMYNPTLTVVQAMVVLRILPCSQGKSHTNPYPSLPAYIHSLGSVKLSFRATGAKPSSSFVCLHPSVVSAGPWTSHISGTAATCTMYQHVRDVGKYLDITDELIELEPA